MISLIVPRISVVVDIVVLAVEYFLIVSLTHAVEAVTSAVVLAILRRIIPLVAIVTHPLTSKLAFAVSFNRACYLDYAASHDDRRKSPAFDIPCNSG